MKTLKFKIFAFGFAATLLSSVFIAQAKSPETNLRYFDWEYFDQYFETDQMISNLDAELQPENNVRIVDADNQVVAAGNENDENIRHYEGIADLLTEIDGVKYYRLSYK